MKQVLLSLGFLLLVPPSCFAVAQQKTVMVHYMPWYSANFKAGDFGWHWTMDRFDPARKKNGLPEIASHFHPLVGPYDSADRHLLEYHVQLMKLTGIDGVIIDWYGISRFRDYGMIHRNTRLLIETIQQAGLQFAICYEDQTLKHRVQAKQIPGSDSVRQAIRDLLWLEENCFSSSNYLRVNGRPALLVFGPQYLDASQWAACRAELSSRPLMFGLPHLVEENRFSGTFGWPPVHGGKTIGPEKWGAYLDQLESSSETRSWITTVFPGFRDIYQQAGVSPSHGTIEHEQGKTFERTLNRALKSRSPIIQVATWNDFGEGTNIEPAVEYGFDYLETLFKKLGSKKGSPIQPQGIQKRPPGEIRVEDLQLPLGIYRYRKLTDPGSPLMEALDAASAELLQGKTGKATRLLADLKSLKKGG